jgi:hypothetical protein
VLGSGLAVSCWLAERSLRDALAETDRRFPGWRLDELEAVRADVPEARNAALRVLAAGRRLSPQWDGDWNRPSAAERDLGEALAGRSPVECLPLETVGSLSDAVSAVRPALAEARSLVDLSDGRYPINWVSDGFSTEGADRPVRW